MRDRSDNQAHHDGRSSTGNRKKALTKCKTKNTNAARVFIKHNAVNDVDLHVTYVDMHTKL